MRWWNTYGACRKARRRGHTRTNDPKIADHGIHWFVTKLWLACEVCSVEALRSFSYELASRIWGFERERAAP